MKLVDYEVKGQGEPLVLLRGLARNRKHWLGFDDLMSRSYRVISIDNRGFGRSRGPLNFSATIYDFARDVIAVMDAESIDKTHIMGVSLGGMITLAMAISHSNRLLSQTIVNSSIGGSFNPRITPKALYTILRYAANRDLLSEHLAGVLVSPSYNETSRLDMIQQWKVIEKEAPASAWNTLVQLLASARFQPQKELRTLALPTLVVYGADDALCPTSNSFLIHKLIPNAQLLKIEHAGHELMTDKPEELKAAFDQFVQSLAPLNRAKASAKK